MLDRVDFSSIDSSYVCDCDSLQEMIHSHCFKCLLLCQGCVYAKLLQSCLTLCNPMDCSPSGSSVHGILQVRILEWVAIPSSRESSQPRARTHSSYVSCIGRWVFYHWHHLEAQVSRVPKLISLDMTCRVKFNIYKVKFLAFHVHVFFSVALESFFPSIWKTVSLKSGILLLRG